MVICPDFSIFTKGVSSNGSSSDSPVVPANCSVRASPLAIIDRPSISPVPVIPVMRIKLRRSIVDDDSFMASILNC